MSDSQNFVPALSVPADITPRRLRKAYHGPQASIPQVDNQPSVRELIALVRKHVVTISVIVGVFFSLALIYCIVTPPLYTATSTIEIKGYAPVLSTVTAETLFGNDTRKLEYQKTTIAKLWRPGIADRVLAREGMSEMLKSYFTAMNTGAVPFLKKKISNAVKAFLPKDKKAAPEETIPDPHYRHSPKVIASYLGLIDINPVIETSLVEIEAVTRDPGLSRTLANAHAESFIEDLRAERKVSMAENLNTLQAQAKELSKNLSDADNELTKYAAENQLIVSNSDEGADGLIMKNLVTLSESLAVASAKRMRSESLLGELKAADPTASTALDDESIRPLRLELEKAQAEYRSLGKKVTAEFPAMQELGARIASLKESIVTQRQALFNGLMVEVASDKAAEATLLKRLDAEKDRGYEQSKKLVRYNVLRKGSASLRGLYEAVLKQVQENQVTAASGASNIVISDYATLPTSPSAPKVKAILVLSTLVGLIVGLLVAILKELLNNKVRAPQDIPVSTNLSVLGILPPFGLINEVERKSEGKLKLLNFKRFRKSKEEKEQESQDALAVRAMPPQLVAFTAPNASVAEALRTIRAALLLSSVDDPAKVLMITSANQGEGKTTMSANLAVSLAQADYKTLLIDADLRQASAAQLFGVDPRGLGLAECISGQVSPLDAVKDTSIDNLKILCAGSRPPNPAELLGSRRMDHLIQHFTGEYDFILFDTAPVLAVADSLMLSQYVDSVILVTRSGKTLKSSVIEACERLRRVKAHLTGFIMNDYRDPSFTMSDMDYYVYPKAAVNG